MRLELGSVTLDTDRHQVFRGDQPAHLSKKAYQLLDLLVENRPRAMSKDEIQRELWPDTFVSDTSLTTLVNEIRTLLEETAREPRFVRTVHGFGYAFEGVASPAPSSGCRLVRGDHELLLEEGENVLGREKGVRVWIDDPAVSRHHARIDVRGGKGTLEDLGSKNGTLVNGRKTRGATPLADGDRVQIGRAEMVLKELRPTGSTQTATHLTRPPVPPEKTPRGKTRGR